MKSEKLWKHQHSSYFSKCTTTKHSATQDAIPFLLTCPSWPPLEMYPSWEIEKTIVYTSPRPTASRNQKGWSEQGERDPIISWVNWILYVFLPHGSYMTQLKCLQIPFSLSSFSVCSKDVGFWFARALNIPSCSWSQRDHRSEHKATDRTEIVL